MNIPPHLRRDSPKWIDTSFRSLLDAAPDAMLVANRAGEIVVANTQAEKLFGYSREQLLGGSVESLIAPRFRDQHARHREDFFGDPRVRPMGVGLELFALRGDGAEVPVEINLSPLTTDSGTFVISTIRDATEFHRVEELKKSDAMSREFRGSEESFRSVADSAPVMFWMSGPDKLCTYFNKPWLDFTGRSFDQERGNGWAKGIHPHDLQRCLDIYTQAFDRRDEFRMEYRVRRQDGQYRCIIDIGVPRFNQDGSFAGYIGSRVDVTERRRAEKAVRESDERFRLAAQAGKMFAYEWDAATDLIVRSGESAPILGIEEATPFTGQQALAKVHPDDRERILSAVSGLSPEKSYLQMSYRMVHPDGTVIWVESSSHAHFDGQRRMLRIAGMVADISERKLAETELALAKDWLRLAMESGKSVGWDWDIKRGRDSWFGDLRNMFGIPSEIYVGRAEDLHRRIHPEDQARVREATKNAMENKEPYAAEYRILWPDGTAHWVAVKGKFYYSPDGEPERMFGMAVDINERKLMEEALRESEERLRLAAQLGKMCPFDWDVATDVVIRSDEGTHILGSTGAQTRLTLQQMLASVHPEDRATVMASVAELTPESPNSRISFRSLRPDGSVIWLERTGHAFFDGQGKLVRIIGMVADITERKLAEEALSAVSGRLLQAQEEERSRIARDLHDDISQRLALLVNHLHGLEKGLPSTAERARTDIRELGKRASEICGDVQAISHRLHSSKLRYLGILAAAKSFCQEVSEQQKVKIDFTHVDIPPILPEEISLCLFRVLQEALHNAVKHSGARHFEVRLRGASGEMQLTIRDFGVGFDPDEAMMSNRGLGLISVRERISLVRGTLSITSRPQWGTELYVRVPLSARIGMAQAAG